MIMYDQQVVKLDENLTWVILKGSLSSKKSGFHLTWQSVFAIIRPENKTPTYSKVINKRKTLSKGEIVKHMPGPLVTAQAGLF